MARKLFCEYGPLAYWLSTKKGRLMRHLANRQAGGSFAGTISHDTLPHVAATYTSPVAGEIEGIPADTVKSRADNIWLSASVIDGLVVRPGEVFSFWHLVGNCTPARGFGKAFIVSGGKMVLEYGGGACLVATLLHNLVLGTPLKVEELHHHSDALFPDKPGRVPYELGVSLLYNYIDYRFQNDTDQTVQIKLAKTPGALVGELRSERPFAHRYQLVEEDHYFAQEADGHFYRNSKIYRLVIDNATGETVGKELMRDNHSQVMYDPKLIPHDLLRPASNLCG